VSISFKREKSGLRNEILWRKTKGGNRSVLGIGKQVTKRNSGSLRVGRWGSNATKRCEVGGKEEEEPLSEEHAWGQRGLKKNFRTKERSTLPGRGRYEARVEVRFKKITGGLRAVRES